MKAMEGGNGTGEYDASQWKVQYETSTSFVLLRGDVLWCECCNSQFPDTDYYTSQDLEATILNYLLKI